jgi:hypothetical protein
MTKSKVVILCVAKDLRFFPLTLFRVRMTKSKVVILSVAKDLEKEEILRVSDETLRMTELLNDSIT